MKTLKTNVYFKLGTIIFLMILFTIPASMIKSLIYEREETQDSAISEVSSKWGEEQTIAGPFISIPYYKFIKDSTKKDSTEKTILV